jgi:peptide/nickel transport system permease protein
LNYVPGFALRRLSGAALSLWIVITITFFAIHLLPGDPAEAALSQSTAPQEVLERRREALGLNRPLIVQYADYAGHLLRGELGVSWATGEPVEVMIRHQLAPTLGLAFCSLIAGAGIGLGLGYLAAVPETDIIRHISRMITGVALGTPVTFSGTLLVWLFAIKLNWLPATGQTGLVSLILPSVVIGFSVSGAVARAVDAGLRSSMMQPFVLTAQAKGLKRSGAVWRHAIPVGLLPMVNLLSVQFGFLLSGTVIAESFFARPGLGRLLLSGVLNQDIPVVQALTILSCGIYITLNIVADILHAVLDPRIQA